MNTTGKYSETTAARKRPEAVDAKNDSSTLENALNRLIFLSSAMAWCRQWSIQPYEARTTQNQNIPNIRPVTHTPPIIRNLLTACKESSKGGVSEDGILARIAATTESKPA